MIPEDMMERARQVQIKAQQAYWDADKTMYIASGPTLAHRSVIAQALMDERIAGGAEMLDRIRASLIEYPNGGIDVVVARRVEHIVGAATDKLKFKIEALKTEVKMLQNRIDDMRGWRIPK